MSDFLSNEAIRAATGGAWWRESARGSAPSGVSIDTRQEQRGRAYVALRGRAHDGNAFAADASRAGAALVLVEAPPPGGAADFPGAAGVLVVGDGRAALAAIASAWRRELAALRVIGITGSAGKTTTRRLVDAALATTLRGSASPKSFNNDIGVPLTLLGARRGDDYLVAEIGMNRPGEIAALARLARPDIAAVTMVGRAHLEGLGSVEAIAREKASILEPLAADGVAVVNGDSPQLAAALATARREGRVAVRRVLRFGRTGAELDLRLVERRPLGSGQEILLADGGRFRLRLEGEHNAVNALAAIGVARSMGLADRAIAEGLAAAAPEAMRLERVEVGGVLVFNDAYNANPDAMAASIRTFAEATRDGGGGAIRRVVVVGEMLELGAAAADCHREIGRLLADVDRTAPIHAVGAVGRHAASYAAGLREGGWRGELAEASDLDAEGLTRIRPLLRPGDRVLLKGSRGAAMERLLAALAAESPADPVLASDDGACR